MKIGEMCMATPLSSSRLRSEEVRVGCWLLDSSPFDRCIGLHSWCVYGCHCGDRPRCVKCVASDEDVVVLTMAYDSCYMRVLSSAYVGVNAKVA